MKTPRVLLGTALAFFGACAIVNFTPAVAQSILQASRNSAETSGSSKAAPVIDEAAIRVSVLPAGGVFPAVEIIRYDERPGIARGAVVTLRVTNKGSVPTDAVTLSLKDVNSLMRPSPPVHIPSLRPGASRVLTANLEAEFSSASQTPTATTAWHERYRLSCGPELRSVMDSLKIQERAHTQGPVSAHQERSLPVIASASGYQKADPYVSICDSVQCLKPCVMVKEIQKQLDGHVVGYSFFAGLNSNYTAYGYARTTADGTAQPFTADTKVPVASVSKLVTAIAAVRILDRNGVKLDDTIGPYLPKDWSVSSEVKDITFAQLLSQTSGIKDYGNVNTNDRKLKEFFSQTITQSNTLTGCSGAEVVDPPHSINPDNHDFCYSNYNFAIFRQLLPRIVTRKIPVSGTWIAEKYVSLVQTNVFDLVDRPNVECKPPSAEPGASNYAYAYSFPGTSAGGNFRDETLKCGGAGWYLSAKDMARVLLSINALDGKILSEIPPKHQFDEMRTRGLGWGGVGPRELQKDGGYVACDGNNCAEISTVAAVFGPVTGPRFVAVLFMNSNISGGPSHGLKAPEVILKAYNNSLYPK